MRLLALAWRQLRRDLAAGELRVLLAALVLAVMSVGSVGLLTDRAERALAMQANTLLGGDAVLRGDEPIGAGLRKLAQRPGLVVTQTHAFPSMVGVGDKLKLGDVRGIGDGFPLRGRFTVLQEGAAREQFAKGIPARGTVWMSRAGGQALSARLGDQVQVGASQLRLTAFVTQEPEASLDYFAAGPKVFLNLSDLPATGLEQPGSRIVYRLVVAGDPSVVEEFVAAVRPELGRGQRLETAADARPEVRTALDRAGRFLGLAALVAVVLAAIAVAMAARRHSARHQAGSAVMRCLGASQGTLVGIHVGELALLGIGASVIGVALAWALQAVAGAWLAQAMQVAVPAAGIQPAIEAVAVGMTVLLAFGIPPVLALRRVSALRVLRQDVDAAEPSAWVVAGLGLSGLGLLLWWKAGSASLGTAMLLGILGTLVTLGLLALGLIAVVRKLRARLRGPLRYGLANVSRRPAASVAQIASLGLGLMVLLLLTFVRTDLLARWQDALPADAPNRFIVNVQPEQLADVKRLIAQSGAPAAELVPMVRARLVEWNGKAVTGDDFAAGGDRAKRLAEREFNLSSAAVLRPDNRITDGHFWPSTGSKTIELSVEEDFAHMLGWKPGDRVVFDVAGQRLAASITSLRKVDWQSFKPNFFVLVSPGVLDGFAASYVGGVHVGNGDALTRNLVAAHPNLTVIDIDAMLAQVRSTVDQVSAVVEAVFYFSLAAGVLVLVAAIGASQDERLLEAAVMRVLGGSRRQLLLAQASEFAVIGLLTGLAAAIAASLLAGVVADQVLDLPFSVDWTLVVTSTSVGVLASVAAGMFATRRILSAPPTVSLRELG